MIPDKQNETKKEELKNSEQEIKKEEYKLHDEIIAESNLLDSAKQNGTEGKLRIGVSNVRHNKLLV